MHHKSIFPALLIALSCALSQSVIAQANTTKKPLDITVQVNAVEEGVAAVQQIGSLFKKKKTEQPAAATPATAATATTPSLNPPSSKSIGTQPNYSGDWKMAVTINETLSADGQRKDATGAHEIGLTLKIDGSRITGEYTWAKGVCAMAKVEGTMLADGNFELVVSYDGSCCSGSKMKLIGAFSDNNTFVAKFKPDGRPATGCTTWWAQVQGTKE